MIDPVFFRIRYASAEPAEKLPLYLFCAEEVERNIPRRYASNGVPFSQLIQLQSGSLRFSTPEFEYPLCPGELLFIPSHTPYAFESYSTGGRYRKTVLELCGRELSETERKLGLDKVLLLKPRKPMLLSEISAAFIDHEDVEETTYYPELMGKIYELLYELSLSRRTEEQTSYPPLLKDACRLLEKAENGSSLKLYRIAKILHTSVATLNRIFRKHLQSSPREYTLRIRMQQAKNLLLNSELSIKETASRLGYCNAFHFSSEFKRIHGKSPSEFKTDYASKE